MLDALLAIVGPKGLLTEPSDMAPWLLDWRGQRKGHALAVVAPASTEETAAVVRLCAAHGQPIFPIGGNTSLCFGAVPESDRPDRPGIVLSLRRMNRIRAIDRAANIATVDAGVVLADLHTAAGQQGRQFGLHLGSEGSAQIGGLISTNAGGTGVVRYGPMRDLVAGLEIVLADGRVLNDLAALRKDHTGYMLRHLFVGAEGTLGIITGAALHLHPESRHGAHAWVSMRSPSDAVALFAGLQDSLEQVIGAAIESGAADDAVIASSIQQAEEIWFVRHAVSDANRLAGPSVHTDISIRLSDVPDFINAAEAMVRSRYSQATIVIVSHLGDGNVHYILIFPRDFWATLPDPEAFTLQVECSIHDTAMPFSGSFSAEHGIGRKLTDELRRLADPVRYALMQDVKRLFDPRNLMNPGVLLVPSACDETTTSHMAGLGVRLPAADPCNHASPLHTEFAMIDATIAISQQAHAILDQLGVPASQVQGGKLGTVSPVDGSVIAEVPEIPASDVASRIGQAHEAFLAWRQVPAPRRGELVRLLGEELRTHKDALGRLVSLEVGKSPSEGLGEVQEMIDICDFAVGLSRQLYGLVIPSERPDHKLTEQWHPAGVVGVISAFNFPVAVWSWNAALALVCGDAVVWKPSEKAPLTALAVQAIFGRAAARFGGVPEGLSTLLIGAGDVGAALVDDPRVPVVSATGSTRMGRIVGERVARRFGRAILELGGNNASIVTPSADLDLTLRAVAFGAMGTAGQRCTTLRRLIVHASVYDALVPRLAAVYRSISVGNPLTTDALVGPLIDGAAFQAMQHSLEAARAAGGVVHGGERVDVNGPAAFYARPALVEMPAQVGPVLEETFAPILYVLRYTDLDEAIALHNGVPQGLSSSIFGTDLREVERFLSAAGSDCGIANVNMGPSGAEIGGAFGGEKETGGGRESGSDAWKAYMRRQTNAINHGRGLPLAQGVRFEVEEGSAKA